VPPFRRQTSAESPLSERVRDAAADAARETQRVREAAVEAAWEAARDGQQRMRDAAREVAQQAPERAQQLRAAAAQLDVRWARSAPARWIRERFMQFVMNPILDHYAARRATGSDKLAHIEEPVILVANHASHMDTPVILSALPRRLRKRTAVAAAADYFYRYRITAWLASLLFNTVPVDRKGGSGGTKGSSHLDKLLDDGWNLLLYPEGSRKHQGDGRGRVRRGAAVLASHHNLPIVPIRVTGTAAAMPPGAVWPKRLRGRLFSRRHRVEVTFGEPIPPLADTAALIERVQQFFESGEAGPSISPYRRRITGSDDQSE
jgi:1-acyl-sn-glycerol-3-phosphate acyltransferase